MQTRTIQLATIVAASLTLAWANFASSKSIELTEKWRIGGEEESEEYLIGVIQDVATDTEGNTYLLDRQLSEVLQFDPDGEYIHSIGREGEGPGEFQRPSGMFLTNDGLVAVSQRFPGKIVLLTPEGEPAGEYPVPRSEEGAPLRVSSASPTKDGLVVQVSENSRREGGMDIKRHLVRADADGKIVTTFLSEEDSFDFTMASFDEKERGGRWAWQANRDGRVFFYSGWEGYDIQVFQPDGSKAASIQKDYEPRKRSAEEKEEAKSRFSFRGPMSQIEVIVAETDRDIQRMYVGPEGTIWVLTSRGALDCPEGTLGTFDVYNESGKSLGEYSLVGEGDFTEDGFFFSDSHLYVVTELNAARRAMFSRGPSEEGGEIEEEEEPLPVSVICYELPQILSPQ